MIGSTNLANRSFYGDTELNASLWHGPTVRALRAELLREHLGRDNSALDDRAALPLYPIWRAATPSAGCAASDSTASPWRSTLRATEERRRD
jgi:phosphatidylserine/phosphatidylglycerophosphate/cardiolipin synthase-like enzyme